MGRNRWIGLALVVTTSVLFACRENSQAPRPAEVGSATKRGPLAAPGRSQPARASELVRLEAWQGEFLHMAHDSARACDQGDAAGCYRLGNLYEEGLGTPRDMAHAHELHQHACDAGRGEACRTLGLLLRYTSGAPADLARVRRLLARACELEFLDACTMLGSQLVRDEQAPDVGAALRLLTRGCRRGYWEACRVLEGARVQIEGAGLEVPSLATLAVSELPVPTPEQACPPLHHMTSASGGGARLNHGLAQVAPELLLAAIPKELRGWINKREAASPAGRSGTRVSTGRVEFIAEEARLTISATDNFRNCTLQPRTGEMALAQPANPKYDKEVVEVNGRSAIHYSSKEHATLSLWLVDRCTVSISTGPPASRDVLVAALREVDLAALERACAKRVSAR